MDTHSVDSSLQLQSSKLTSYFFLNNTYICIEERGKTPDYFIHALAMWNILKMIQWKYYQ